MKSLKPQVLRRTLVREYLPHHTCLCTTQNIQNFGYLRISNSKYKQLNNTLAFLDFLESDTGSRWFLQMLLQHQFYRHLKKPIRLRKEFPSTI